MASIGRAAFLSLLSTKVGTVLVVFLPTSTEYGRPVLASWRAVFSLPGCAVKLVMILYCVVKLVVVFGGDLPQWRGSRSPIRQREGKIGVPLRS